LSSCKSDNFEEMFPACDTTETITWQADILPIMETRCGTDRSSCHFLGGNLVYLGSYDETMDVANDGDLLGVILHQSGYPPMPGDGGMLDDCSIDKIRAWINRGYPQ